MRERRTGSNDAGRSYFKIRKGAGWWMQQKRVWIGGLSALGLGVVFLFQNCTQPATGEDSSSAEAANVDFAYDTTVDQIAYMSCSNMTDGAYDTSAYFSFRAGAYRNAGLGLTSTFSTAYKSATQTFRAAMLSESPANNATVMQLAIRPVNSYQNIVVGSSSGSATVQADYDNVFTPLGEANISYALSNLAANNRMRYMRDGTPEGTRIEGSVRFTSSSATTAAIRSDLQNGNRLALTYSNSSSSGAGDTLARSPADVALYKTQNIDANRIVYGHGFSMTFGQPTVSGLYGNFPAQVMRTVTEFDLSTGAAIQSNWSCNPDLQFRIVQRADLASASANCNLVPDPPTLSSELTIVRQSLRAEDWYVDMTNHCVIPKKTGTGCYGDNTTVNYNLTTNCDPTNTAALCTSYVSVCTRGN